MKNSVLADGPQGIPYLSVDKLCGRKLNSIDVFVGLVVIPCVFGYVSLPLISQYMENDSVLNMTSEGPLLAFIKGQLEQKVYIGFIHPLLIQLLAFLAIDDVKLLRVASFVTMSLVLSTLYFISAKANINRLLSLSFIGYVMLLSPIQEYALSNLVENVQLLGIMTLFLSWQSIKYKIYKCSKWSVLLTVSSIVVINTKYLGSTMTWLWFITIAMYHLWQNVLPDIQNFKSTRNFVHFSSAVVLKATLIPFTILFASYFVQIYLMLFKFDNNVSETLSFMPTAYKKLIPDMNQYQSRPIYFNETVVRIRHKESLGGYLSTLPDVLYPSGSGDQIGFLSQIENNEYNKWLIEAAYAMTKTGIPNHAKIRLRNVKTGKLLRASSAQPPVSDQEYNSEVSLTGGRNFTGDSDETWTIEFTSSSPTSRKLSPKEILQSRHQGLELFVNTDSEFYLVNEGQRCSLLSHDIDLPTFWKGIDDIFVEKHRQELICIESPTRSRTIFKFESAVTPESTIDKQSELNCTEKALNIVQLIPDMVKRFYKYNYYIQNADFSRARREEDIDADDDYNELPFQNRVEVNKWIFWQPPNMISEKYSKIFISCTFMIIGYVIFELCQLLFRWNPFNSKSQSVLIQMRLNDKITDQWLITRWIFEDFALECFLGWLFHYYIFTSSVHWNLDIVLYLPSFFFSMLLSMSILDILSKWYRFLILIVPIFFALIF